jgi:hypothetical protein
MMADITVIDEGTILLLKPETDQGREWLDENIGRDNSYQPYWPTVVVEHRFVEAILDGMEQDGVTVDG